MEHASSQPRESSSFRVVTPTPLSGSPAPSDLVAGGETPFDSFFVRNHGEILHAPPDIRVDGLVRTPLTLAHATLSAFQRTTIEATLQCAGNRRAGLHRVKPIVNELPWTSEAIGNATALQM